MRQYVIDKLIELLIGISIIVMVLTLTLFGPVASKVIVGLVAIVWGYLDWQILVLPLDLLLGEKEAQACFSKVLCFPQYEFFRKLYACIWRWDRAERALDLTVPFSLPRDEIETMPLPPKDVMLDIRYYRLSRILIGWKMK